MLRTKKPGICLRGKGALLLWSWEAVLSSGAFTKHSERGKVLFLPINAAYLSPISFTSLPLPSSLCHK